MKTLMNGKDALVYIVAIGAMLVHALKGNVAMTIGAGVIVLSWGLLLIAKNAGVHFNNPKITNIIKDKED